MCISLRTTSVGVRSVQSPSALVWLQSTGWLDRLSARLGLARPPQSSWPTRWEACTRSLTLLSLTDRRVPSSRHRCKANVVALRLCTRATPSSWRGVITETSIAAGLEVVALSVANTSWRFEGFVWGIVHRRDRQTHRLLRPRLHCHRRNGWTRSLSRLRTAVRTRRKGRKVRPGKEPGRMAAEARRRPRFRLELAGRVAGRRGERAFFQ